MTISPSSDPKLTHISSLVVKIQDSGSLPIFINLMKTILLSSQLKYQELQLSLEIFSKVSLTTSTT